MRLSGTKKKWKPFRVIRKQYRRGYTFEKRVKKDFENKGWYCMDSRGSHGIADVACWEPTNSGVPRVTLIQCKTSKTGMSQKAMKEFKIHCKKHGCSGLFAFREGRKLVYLQLA